MQFHTVKARPNWKQTASELGFLSTIFDDPPYWVEALEQPFYASFSTSEINDLIVPATEQIVDMANKTVDTIINSKNSKEYFDRLKTPVRCREAISASWNNGEPSLRGRLDFSYSDNQLKLLELNFDGAISLYEASVFQRIWLDELVAGGIVDVTTGQANNIHEMLINAFARFIPEGKTVHFTSLGTSPEEDETVKYLQSCAMVAGIHTQYLNVKSLGHTPSGQLIDLKKSPIEYLVKLYPWENLFKEDAKVAEQSGKSVLLPLIQQQSVHFFEPAWKSLLSNKGILAIMAELFPDNPYLLKSALEGSPEADALKLKPYAKKPLHGMQGANIALVYPDDPLKTFSTPGDYGNAGLLIQQLHPLPVYNDYHVLVGSWVIDGKPAGIGMRADLSPITTGTHCLFIPHVVN